jgi:hypothetical protein
MLPLITYTVVRTLPPPPLTPGTLASYEVAGNGVFYHAAHPALEARVCVTPATIRGLPPLDPLVALRVPRVPGEVLLRMLEIARGEHDDHGPLEVLFHLTYTSEQGWQVHLPAQRQTRLSVEPLDTGADSTYERALIEVHSHHAMRAFYSHTDAADDHWFRFNVVLGRIFDAPELLVQLGVDGYHATVPADTIFHLPDGIRDVGAEDGRDEPLDEDQVASDALPPHNGFPPEEVPHGA